MDHYNTLGLTHMADGTAIRAAYRALAKVYHPDVSKLPDAHERFVAITEAYEVLSDPLARDRYDRTRQSPSPKRASPQNEARYARATEARQRAAREHAEQYTRMRYDQFDQYAFDTVAGYLVPKVLGCFGIAIVALVLFALLLLIREALDLPAFFVMLGMMVVVGLSGWASATFDVWHNERQVRKKMGRR